MGRCRWGAVVEGQTTNHLGRLGAHTHRRGVRRNLEDRKVGLLGWLRRSDLVFQRVWQPMLWKSVRPEIPQER